MPHTSLDWGYRRQFPSRRLNRTRCFFRVRWGCVFNVHGRYAREEVRLRGWEWGDLNGDLERLGAFPFWLYEMRIDIILKEIDMRMEFKRPDSQPSILLN